MSSWYQSGSNEDDERKPLRPCTRKRGGKGSKGGGGEPFSVQIQQIGSPKPDGGASSSSHRKSPHADDDVEGEEDEEDFCVDCSSDSDSCDGSDDEGGAGGGGAGTGEIERTEIISSFYELDDVRIPPAKFKKALKLFYAFFLAVGVGVHPVKLSRRKQHARRFVPGGEQAAKDNALMAKAGSSPTPLIGERWDWAWRLIAKWQVVYYALFMTALAFYTTLNVLAAMHSSAKFLKVFFAAFLLLSVLASENLASELLSSRLIGTRIFYTCRNTTHRSHVNKLIRESMWTPIPFCLAIAALGVVTDFVVRDEYREALHHFLGGAMVEPLVVLWMCCSVLVRLQLVTGLGVFAALMSIHLLRIDSCMRSMKRPGMSVHAASVQVFDVDVSLADLSHTLDARLTTLLVASALTFFFEAIFLSNRANDNDPTNDGSARDLLTLAVPGLLCVWILLGCSSVNHAAQRMKLVAQRFAGFQERERLQAKYGATKQKYLDAADKSDENDADDEEEEAEEDASDSEQKDGKKKSKAKGQDDKSKPKQGSKSKDGAANKTKDKAKGKGDKNGTATPAQQGDKKKKKSDKKSSDAAADDQRKNGGGGDGKEVAASASSSSGGGDGGSKKQKAQSAHSNNDVVAQARQGPHLKSGHSDPENDDESSGASESENERDIATRIREESDPRSDASLRARVDIGLHALGAEALERSDRDRDGDGDIDIDDDLELLAERLVAFVNYLKYADISLRLANVQLDQKLAWGFFLVGVSTIFSVLQIDKLNFLP